MARARKLDEEEQEVRRKQEAEKEALRRKKEEEEVRKADQSITSPYRILIQSNRPVVKIWKIIY